MTTANPTVPNRAIDVTAPPKAIGPLVFTGEIPAAPGPLPRSTEWRGVNVMMEAVRREWRMWVAVAVLALGFAGMSVWIMPGLPYQAQIIGQQGYLLVSILILALLLRWSLIKVLVLRRTRAGEEILDSQEWWRSDLKGWPASWHITLDGKRRLFISTLEYEGTPETLFPVVPDLAPIEPPPTGAIAARAAPFYVTPATIAYVQARAAAVRKLGMTFDRRARAMRQILLLFMLAGAGVLIMAGGIFNYKMATGQQTAEIAERQRLLILEELRRQGVIQPQPAPFTGPQLPEFNPR